MKLTLPLTVGQRVICVDGKVRTVTEIKNDGRDHDIAYFDRVDCVWVHTGTTTLDRTIPEFGFEAVRDEFQPAEEPWKPRKRTLSL